MTLRGMVTAANHPGATYLRYATAVFAAKSVARSSPTLISLRKPKLNHQILNQLAE
jgi:hypothetical protein